MAAPILPRIKLDTRASNTLLSVAVIVALFAAYYMMVSKEPVPADAHVTYEARTAGRVTLRVDMLASGITRVTGADGRAAEYATPDFAVRRVMAAFRRQKFLDADVAAFPPVKSAQVCQFGMSANHRKALVRYDCAAPPALVKAPLQVFAETTHFCKMVRSGQADCP